MKELNLSRRSVVAHRIMAELSADLGGQELQLMDERDDVTGYLVRSLRAEIFGFNHPKKHVVSYPANWKESVKERFAPLWFLQRFPVKYTDISVSLEETFPGLSGSAPGHQSVFKLLVHERKDQP